MKLRCSPEPKALSSGSADVPIRLYGRSGVPGQGSAGADIAEVIQGRSLSPAQRAWDLLSLALSVASCDLAGHRNLSPDGWTREFEVEVAVDDPDFWNTLVPIIEKYLSFLTTDIWNVIFISDGFQPSRPKTELFCNAKEVVLLSGGLDSYVGGIDLVAKGVEILPVSHLVRGDAEKQVAFARQLGGADNHLQMNHNIQVPDAEVTPSQRARSIIFLSYGVLAATTLGIYRAGSSVLLNTCENGLIAINPPLTPLRIGSLSTRTMHPYGLALFQEILDAADLKVQVLNPYAHKTKGEMLKECTNQTMLAKHAHETTSCGRFLRYGYQHCGRCVPCLIRRAAFNAWGIVDRTEYKFRDLSIDDADHGRFDDVRSLSMAAIEMQSLGVHRWIGASLASTLVKDRDLLMGVVERGLDEVKSFLDSHGVK